MKNISIVAACIAVAISISALILANNANIVEPVVIGASEDGDSNFTNLVTSGDVTVGDDLTVTDDTTISGDLSATGGLTLAGQIKNTPATITATTTLTSSSASLQLFGATANYVTVTLPAVTATGTFFRFQVAGAQTGAAVIIDSAEGDNIDGTLIVAGAVVDCRGEDQINIITDGEVTGDYVELYSIGSQWVLVDSGVLASGKMTCTDPS